MRRFIRVNERIRAPQIRLIGPEGEQLGVVPVKEGLERAVKEELDLVEVAAQVNPPVCRIMDFSKYKYEQEKREREAKKHRHKSHLKEIRLKPRIEEHDYLVKFKQLERFLKEKNKVKVSLMFRGREMAHRELGQQVLNRFIAESSSFGQLEKSPVLEGRFMNMVIAPK